MNHLIQEFIRPLLRDLFLHRKVYVLAFVAILALFTTAGVHWPGRYSSAATVFVEQRNILGPLMEGAAVQTDVREQAGLARELIFGRRILGEVAREVGFVDDSMSPAEVDFVLNQIRDRTSIDLVGENLIEIEYSDVDPERTYRVVSLFTSMFIEESKTSKLRESRSAYDFIDKQVAEYAARLDEIAERIKSFRNENQTIVPGAEAAIRERMRSLTLLIEDQEQQIREAEVKAASLRAQLSGERETAEVAVETDQLQQRIVALQARLDSLLLSYHEKYPDVVALKEQIAELKELARQGGVVVISDAPRQAESERRRQDDSIFSAVGQQLRQELYNTTTLIATLQARLADSRRKLAEEGERIRRIPEFEARLAELNRDLEVNQALYNDLIRRREYARVSMNVDQEDQGLTLRVHEPAEFPTHTSGPRLIHFVAFGVLMAFGSPLGGIVAKQQLDQRIRVSGKLEAAGDALPVFVDIPHLATPREGRRLKMEYALLALLLMLAIAGAGGTGYLRLMGVV